MSGVRRDSWAGGGGLAAVRRRISLQKETAQGSKRTVRTQNSHALSDTHNATHHLRTSSAASSRAARNERPAFNLTGLPQQRWTEYNGIYDETLADHFSRDVWRRDLHKNGLLAKKGYLLSRDALRKEAKWGRLVEGAVRDAEKDMLATRGNLKYLRYKCMVGGEKARDKHERKVRRRKEQDGVEARLKLARMKSKVQPPPRPATAATYRPITPTSIFASKSMQLQLADVPTALPFEHPARVATPSVSDESSERDDIKSETTLYARSTLSPSLRSEGDLDDF